MDKTQGEWKRSSLVLGAVLAVVTFSGASPSHAFENKTGAPAVDTTKAAPQEKAAAREQSSLRAADRSRGISNSGGSAETSKLLKSDDLLPTQNRTQAMRLESETGHINPGEDAILAPKKNLVPSPLNTPKAAKSRRTTH